MLHNPFEVGIYSNSFIDVWCKRIERKVDMNIEFTQPFFHFVIEYGSIGGYYNFQLGI